MENKNDTIIGKFIEKVKEIKEKNGINKSKDNSEVVFRAFRNIEGINKFIKYIENCEISKEKVNKFLQKKSKIKHPEKLKKFINSFINNNEFKTKKSDKLFNFWIKNENPALFNNSKLTNNERLIYKDFIASNPDKFNNMTTFDILTKMRHYEVPNRLLDVTYDPLVALYFACSKYGDNNASGRVFVYAVNDKNIKYYDSDTVTILSVLTKLKKQHKKQLKEIIDIFKKSGNYYNSEDKIGLNYNKKTSKSIDFSFDESKNKFLMKIDNSKVEFNYDQELKETIMKTDNEKFDIKKIKPYPGGKIKVKDFFNFLVSNVVGELNWQLKQEIPSWHEGIFDLETFTQCYLVKPKMNNPRIIAQSGAFFIYPFKDIDITKSLMSFGWTQVDINKLKKELKLLNIKETKYMPDDLTKYTNEIIENITMLKDLKEKLV